MTIALLAIGALQEPFDPARLERELLVPACEDPMQCHVLGEGRVLFIERAGPLKQYDPRSGKITTLAKIPVALYGEVGLIGLVAARDFETTGHLYLFFCPQERRRTLRLSRFTLRDGALDAASERKLLEYDIDPEAAHMGGGLAIDARGMLYVGTGDNSPPIAEVPMDQRPGRKNWDALRTSANTRDLRGKVLRIRPLPDGTYETPPDNLFADGRDGRPEILAMGLRNAFRISVDDATGWVYAGNVGPNIDTRIGMGPEGYDEIEQVRTAGNFGWPMFTGPNEPYALLDFATRKVGAKFDPAAPLNPSRNNTGARELPPARPAFIWYPSGVSDRFPELGHGARCAMAGPVYRFYPSLASPVKLPAHFDGTLFIYDWNRNWIKAVRLNAAGDIARIEPFMPAHRLRRPIDLKLGPDGALYVVEYGDLWGGNRDAQIARLVYRRGNRAPVAAADVTPAAGREPLTVRLDARRSHDPDRDAPLTFAWRADAKVVSQEPVATVTFDRPGIKSVELTVTDPGGLRATTATDVSVGNAPPRVRITQPLPGGFFDWNEPIEFAVDVEDPEDGATADGTIPSDRVVTRFSYRRRRPQPGAAAGDEDVLEPGLTLMRRSTCFSCHTTSAASAGPPYQEIARKYAGDAAARERLAQKVLRGGGGVWAPQPMPPNPQHTIEEARVMIDWVLSLASEADRAPVPGAAGFHRTMKRPEKQFALEADAGIYLLTATYSDNGRGQIPSLTAEATHVLHGRRKQPAFADAISGAEVAEIYEPDVMKFVFSTVARFAAGDFVVFREMNLEGIERVSARVSSLTAPAGRALELRIDAPDGPRVARLEPPPPGASPLDYVQVRAPVRAPDGLHDLYVVATGPADAKKFIDVHWLYFHESDESSRRRAERRRETERRLAERAPKPRPFVRDWTVEELADLGPGGSVERGGKLFEQVGCATCHRVRGHGGTLGPDLSARRRAADPRRELLRDLIEPSALIEPKYRVQIIETNDERSLAGIVVREAEGKLWVAVNPAKPDQTEVIAAAEIKRRKDSPVSMMPERLLSTLARDEILDLVAYLEAGGDAAAAAWEARFDRERGWTGADAAYTVDLGDRVLWLFGDTWIDRFTEGRAKIVRNSIAISQRESIEFVESEFFKPPDGRGWIWPASGFTARGRLYLFLGQYDTAGRKDVWNFRRVRTWLGVVPNFADPPDRWRIEYREAPDGWGVASVVEGEHVWVFGTREAPLDRTWRVRRVALDRIEQPDGWGASSEDLFHGAGSEGSVSRHGDRFVAIYTELGMSPKILMRRAPRPDGPWSEPTLVYTCPEAGWDPTYFCYAAKGHPEFSGPGELWVTYAVNSTDFGKAVRDARIYRPRFVRVKMEP
jgi:cytochrome c